MHHVQPNRAHFGETRDGIIYVIFFNVAGNLLLCNSIRGVKRFVMTESYNNLWKMIKVL